MSMPKKVRVIVPTYNAGDAWRDSVALLRRQVDNCMSFHMSVLVVDSSSTDNTVLIAEEMKFDTVVIDKNDFNHGGTRNFAVSLFPENDFDFVVFLTQDAALANDTSIETLLSAFSDNNVAVAYGRQLPHADANEVAKHARYFNYPIASSKYDLSTKKSKGIKTVFCSNSFSAYRVIAFNQLGGFPINTILCEDMYFAAKAVLAGYKVAYVSDALVKHSHNYTFYDEFKRYFDIGVFHVTEPWIREEFGGSGGEGKRFIISEFKYLMLSSPIQVFRAITNNIAKILGYRLGFWHERIPMFWKKKFSMHKGYWDNYGTEKFKGSL
ncbi:glycosyltransferase family 2 protein [Serratia fonticola]|uniref:glycosyltransferase family 2 protein n=1 Tax=Serratia fonticola TaxID=47917 RepID=UPI00217C3B0A|nr:glycosyltransferase [Serratia fonticola]MDK2375914.1 glycosyltransferase [Serratia fonticola]CAI1561600.1 Predicted glycosyl hydrolase [Serratia fonticola]CAI1638277.1 Predicted glycosyl hydrolase [Serratia fonticola]CAI1675790.1 Predicted glycosyl hydrolase [Serratia fonticola]